MRLNQVDIFIENYEKPELVITYTLKDKTNTIDMFKIWISDEHKRNLEIINYGNLLLYNIIITNENTPVEREIFVAYQKVFNRKLIPPYKVSHTDVNVSKTLLKAPYNAFKELTREYMSNHIENVRKKYIDKHNKKEIV